MEEKFFFPIAGPHIQGGQGDTTRVWVCVCGSRWFVIVGKFEFYWIFFRMKNFGPPWGVPRDDELTMIVTFFGNFLVII